MISIRVLSVLGVLCSLSLVGSFPDGAPVEACIYKNHPNHPGTKSLPPSSFPFAFTASSSTFHPGSTVKVVISGPPFKGFFVQAREGGPKGKWIGEFIGGPRSKLHPECSAITHNNVGAKKEVVLTWKAPPHHSGKVVFLGTILVKYDVYWVNIIAKTPEGPQHPGNFF
ncbi:UNVERIFIED_CONTAM: hypothetical protein RMT77_015851 [Armadillidium vulgare]